MVTIKNPIKNPLVIFAALKNAMANCMSWYSVKKWYKSYTNITLIAFYIGIKKQHF